MTGASLTIGDAPPANDNAYATGRPLVRVPRGRAEATYARSENVILPLRFAERMAGWQPRTGANRRHIVKTTRNFAWPLFIRA
jgi:hypothetical protein